jgi:menaquinol-cytochrome c reductase iron-sulfur subunit
MWTMKTEGKKGTTVNPLAADEGAKPGPLLPERRVFFERLVEIAAGCVAILLAIPFVRFLLEPVVTHGHANSWSQLGPANQFESLTAPVSHLVTVAETDGWLESGTSKPVYVTKNNQGRLEVLSAVCPHLGCTVQWNGPKKEFICPCHGSVFAPDGTHIAGPAPRSMDSLPIRVQNGMLLVRYEAFRQLLPVKQVAD